MLMLCNRVNQIRDIRMFTTREFKLKHTDKRKASLPLLLTSALSFIIKIFWPIKHTYYGKRRIWCDDEVVRHTLTFCTCTSSMIWYEVAHFQPEKQTFPFFGFSQYWVSTKYTCNIVFTTILFHLILQLPTTPMHHTTSYICVFNRKK